MGEMATYNIPKTQTVRLTAAAVGRGLRIALNTSDLGAAAGAAVRGEFVALNDGVASGLLAACPIEAGGSAPCKSNGATAIVIGDTIYAAANGLVANTGTVVIGKARTAAANGVTSLFVVQFSSVI